MKRTKKLVSIFAAVALIASVIAVPTSVCASAAFPGETVIYENDFEKLDYVPSESSGTIFARLRGENAPKGFMECFNYWSSASVEGYEGGRALSPTFGATGNDSPEFSFDPLDLPKSGVAHFRFDYKIGTSENVEHYVRFKRNDSNLYNNIFNLLDGTKWKSDAWYNMHIKVDFDAKEIFAVAVNKADSADKIESTVSFQDTYPEGYKPLGISIKCKTNAMDNRTESASPKLDNFVYSVDNIEDSEIVYKSTFNGLTDTIMKRTYLTDNKGIANRYFFNTRYTGTEPVPTSGGYNGTKAISPSYGTTAKGRQLWFYSNGGSVVTSGKYRYSFDYLAALNEDRGGEISIARSAGTKSVVFSSTETKAMGANWYHIDIEADYSTGIWNAVATPYTSGSEIVKTGGYYNGIGTGYPPVGILFSCGGSQTNKNSGPVIDNFECAVVNTANVSLTSVTKEDEEVAAAADFTGDVKINYTSSDVTYKNRNFRLLIAYYNDTELKYADIVNLPIGVESTGASVNYTVPASAEGYDSVKVMLWDDLTSLNPVSSSLDF